ncbi:MAG: energy-coupling factor transporter ATPase [Oscillospiraceae bacterium]|nr:energy-coupling factor transporter ATPase [Oscillospiraceae bacterium]
MRKHIFIYQEVKVNDLIRFEKVSFSYGTNNVLDSIDLSVEEGEFLAVLGYNGSGKSTLAKLINGILLPTEGKVYVDGMDTSDETKLSEIRKTAGMVFQNPDNQIVATIVEEDVAFAPENLGLDPAEIRQRVDEAIQAVGLEKHIKDAPHKLSGGQKQRVAIAGVLAMQPRCIILDEPTAMLDPKGRSLVMGVIERLNREKGITIILITHFMEEAALADRILILSDGKVAENGPPKEVFSRKDRMISLGLEVPPVTDLTLRLIDNGLPLEKDIIRPEELVEALLSIKEAAH